jgi:hypothetical protein
MRAGTWSAEQESRHPIPDPVQGTRQQQPLLLGLPGWPKALASRLTRLKTKATYSASTIASPLTPAARAASTSPVETAGVGHEALHQREGGPELGGNSPSVRQWSSMLTVTGLAIREARQGRNHPNTV